MTLQNTKISLRTDDLSNWTSVDPVLKRGEFAVVNDISAGIIRLKVGNGVSSFTDLDFINDPKVITRLLDANGVQAKYIEQGAHVQASPLALAAGAHLTATANFSQALGFNAQAMAGDDYSFVWNGDDTRLLADEYQTHGKGTFNISPLSGLSGIYIGDVTLADILSANAWSVASSLTAYYTKDETSSSSQISDALSAKQDLLTDLQISAIDSTVLIRQTCMKFSDSTMSAFDFTGCIDQQDLADAGLTGTSMTSRLQCLKIGTAVSAVGISAFAGCSLLSSIYIPFTVNTLSSHSFARCTSLSSVFIPESVDHVGDYAFKDCSSLNIAFIGILEQGTIKISYDQIGDINAILDTINGEIV